ncbi:MAG TPA: SDR family NAD(P)-dependent oxidoreductase [Paludibaculum sp.]|jgi:NAD(P)-dependent dehydrogenase (short-subunit alcohol dehydrogenase family)
MDLLAQKTVLVTGASGALGEEVCLAFQAAGAFVAGAARHAAQLQHCDLAITADLSAPAGAVDAVAATLAARPTLDAVVHLMGGFAAGGSAQDTPIEIWDRMMDLNARAAFSLFRAALPPMVAQRRGRLIAIGSRAGVTTPAGLSAYAASKAALHALVQVIAAENVHTGVTANVVMPSTIDTAVNRAAMPDADPARWVSPQSIAGLLVWLASDASKDVNGALLPIYGQA